jgi:hypothetical protein
MASKSSPPSTGAPAGVPPSGNGKYVAIAVLLLGLIGAAIYWKVNQKPVTITVQADAGPAPPASSITIRDDDIPLPPPVEDAGTDAGKKVAVTSTYSPSMCDAKTCTGKSTAELAQALQFHARQGRRCYDNALAQDPTLKGKVSIAVRVGANGTLCSAGVASNELGNANVANCIANQFRTSSFPAPKGGCADFNIPINLVPRQ